MKGVWKDTIFTLPGHLVRFRTRYERYIGDFVLHCHILDHEDQGMMQNVRIGITDGDGGIAIGHH
nr:multicopper oxidase domain-containing protein [Jiella avicenniae]